MGIGGISIWQLLIILAIVVMLFGTKRLRTMGSDLGAAIKGFRSSMTNEEPDSPTEEPEGDSAQLKEQSDKNE
jgi:sec-independent protein translocase protein TatA